MNTLYIFTQSIYSDTDSKNINDKPSQFNKASSFIHQNKYINIMLKHCSKGVNKISDNLRKVIIRIVFGQYHTVVLTLLRINTQFYVLLSDSHDITAMAHLCASAAKPQLSEKEIF